MPTCARRACTRTWSDALMWGCLLAYMHACMHALIHRFMQTHTCEPMCTHVCVCMHIYVHICFHSAFHPCILCSYQHMHVQTDVCGGIIDCVLRFLHTMCVKAEHTVIRSVHP